MGQKNEGHHASLSIRGQGFDGTTSNALDFSYYQPPSSHDTYTSKVNLISSPAHVFDAIRNFDQRKKEIVRSIGFSGLLNLSRFSEIDPQFTLWLIRKVRWSTRALHISDKMNFVIMPEHIGKIIGIPYGGIEVSDKAFEDEDDKMAFMKLSLAFLGNESCLLASAEAYVCRELPFVFSKEDANKFKVAFVIFVMGRFLAPSLDTSSARSDFWGALRNPDAIHSFNWSSFILSDMIEASRVVVWDILRNRNISVILGCPLILQILYFDNIEIGHLKLGHDVIPRVKHFSSDLLRQMILADFVPEESSMAAPVFGRAKVFRTDNTCYCFPSSGSAITPPPSCLDTPRATSSKMPQNNTHQGPIRCHPPGNQPINPTNLSNYTPPLAGIRSAPESDVPDFAAIMREYYQGQVDSSLLECFRFHQAMCLQHFTKFANGLKAAITKENINLVSKVVNHQRRCSGLPPIKLDLTRPLVTRRTYDDMLSGAESGDDMTPASISSKYASRFAKKDTSQPCSFKSSKLEHGSSSSPFPRNNSSSGNFGNAILSVLEGADLNEKILEAEYLDSPIMKKIVHPGRLAVTQWARNIDHPIRDVALTHSFYDWLCTTTSSDLNKAWIMHDFPRFIQITGKQLKDHFTGIQPMAHDSFDLCVRRITQLDKFICPKGVHLRWRHLIESDFSTLVLGGENPSCKMTIRNQFISTYLDYELERCRMFFVPVFVDCRWWCYAWDLKTLTLTINDPSVGQESDALVIQKHAGTIEFLNKSLSETILQFYSGWTPKFKECNIVVFRTPDMPIERSQSALFTLFFIKNYNGTNLVTTTSTNALQKFKEYMLYEILELKDNRANPPADFIHSIDD